MWESSQPNRFLNVSVLFRSVIECLIHKSFVTITAGFCGIFELSQNCGWYVWSKDQGHIQRMETPWFPVSKVFLDTVLSFVLWDINWILLTDFLEYGATIMAKYYIALFDIFKQQLVSKHGGKLSKEILFLQENSASQSGHYAQEIGGSSLWISETLGLLTWYGPFGLLPLS